MNILALIIGLAIAVIVILRFKSRRLENTKWAYPLLLASFPIYYWVFAISAKDYHALVNEISIGFLFFFVAFLAYRFKSPLTMLLLGIGFVSHALYDFFHASLFNNSGTPIWWPEFCGAVDIFIGLYILYLACIMGNKSRFL